MLISLYFIAIGGVFYMFFIRPPTKDSTVHTIDLPILGTKPAINKKAAKSNA